MLLTMIKSEVPNITYEEFLPEVDLNPNKVWNRTTLGHVSCEAHQHVSCRGDRDPFFGAHTSWSKGKDHGSKPLLNIENMGNGNCKLKKRMGHWG